MNGNENLKLINFNKEELNIGALPSGKTIFKAKVGSTLYVLSINKDSATTYIEFYPFTKGDYSEYGSKLRFKNWKTGTFQTLTKAYFEYFDIHKKFSDYKQVIDEITTESLFAMKGYKSSQKHLENNLKIFKTMMGK